MNEYYFTAAKVCPSSHPFAYNNGASCCYFYNRINDSTNANLDGNPLHYSDPEEYCADSISPAVDSHGQKLKTNEPILGQCSMIIFGISEFIGIAYFSNRHHSVWYLDVGLSHFVRRWRPLHPWPFPSHSAFLMPSDRERTALPAWGWTQESSEFW